MWWKVRSWWSTAPLIAHQLASSLSFSSSGAWPCEAGHNAGLAMPRHCSMSFLTSAASCSVKVSTSRAHTSSHLLEPKRSRSIAARCISKAMSERSRFSAKKARRPRTSVRPRSSPSNTHSMERSTSLSRACTSFTILSVAALIWPHDDGPSGERSLRWGSSMTATVSRMASRFSRFSSAICSLPSLNVESGMQRLLLYSSKHVYSRPMIAKEAASRPISSFISPGSSVSSSAFMKYRRALLRIPSEVSPLTKRRIRATPSCTSDRAFFHASALA
mmetsp:Transcript_17587/g.45867  ORF Transcript_17587/g.45867 Transcript_17587/m.45867 type:complete len:275 (-) Transcript_17587:54-878(-)